METYLRAYNRLALLKSPCVTLVTCCDQRRGSMEAFAGKENLDLKPDCPI